MLGDKSWYPYSMRSSATTSRIIVALQVTQRLRQILQVEALSRKTTQEITERG